MFEFQFPDPKSGEWFGYLTQEGKVALDFKGGPFKGQSPVRSRCTARLQDKVQQNDTSVQILNPVSPGFQGSSMCRAASTCVNECWTISWQTRTDPGIRAPVKGSSLCASNQSRL